MNLFILFSIVEHLSVLIERTNKDLFFFFMYLERKVALAISYNLSWRTALKCVLFLL